jgi:hypothetical protein
MNATTYGLDVAKRIFQMYWPASRAFNLASRIGDNPSFAPAPS